MKKLYFLLSFFIVSFAFSQGNETFDNFPSTSSSYVDGTFVGQDGSTWTYTQCRGDNMITGQSVMIGRNRTPQAEFYSGTISGGIGTITFNYKQAFSTNVNLNVLVNDILVGNVTSSGEQNVVKASGTITVNQPGDVVIKFINANNSDGQVVVDDVVWTGFTGAGTPTVSVSSPADMSTFPSGTTMVPVVFTTANTNAGDQVNITVNGVLFANETSPFDITTTDGESYTVLVELVDSGMTQLDMETIDFSVEFPCDLQLGTITTTCDANTGADDSYTTTIDFTGGGTSTYTIDTGGVGTVDISGGNDPSVDASGTITITGGVENSNITVTITGDVANSSCNLIRTINSPACLPAITCPAVGSLVITEYLSNATGTDTNKEWFEVYNSSAAAIDLLGWVILDDGSDSHTITSSVNIMPGAYAVIGQSTVMADNGGITVDYAYGNDMFLSNTSDEIVLTCNGTEIDRVNYDGSFPNQSGASISLSTSTLNATDNDTAGNWGLAVTPFGTNGDLGTPGAINDFSLSTNDFINTSFSVYPNPTNTGFVNIKSQSNEAISVIAFDILGKQVINTTISDNTLNVSKLNSGIYILNISQNNNTITKKLVVN